MISASEFLKGNTAKSGSSTNTKFVSASEFLKKQPAPTTKPKKETTLGGDIIRSIVKTPARLATNLIQAAGIVMGDKDPASIQPFSGKYLGEVKSVGTSGNFKKDLKESVGAGVEMASYIPVAKGVGTLKSILTSKGKALLPLAGEGALSGLLGSTGMELGNNARTGEKVSLKNIAMSTAGGAVAGPILGVGARTLGRVFGKSSPKIVDNIPSVETPKLVTAAEFSKLTPEQAHAKYAKSQGYEPVVPDSQLPTIDAGTTPKSTLPTVQVGESPVRKVPGDFTYEPVAQFKYTANIPETPKQVVETPLKVNKADLIPEQEVSEVTRIIQKDIPDIETGPVTVKEQLARFKELESTDPEKLLDIATNPNTQDTLKNNWARSWLINKAEKTGDIQLIKRLAESGESVESEVARELYGSRFKRDGNIADILRDVIKVRSKKVGVTDNLLKKEVSKASKLLKNSIEKLTGVTPTKVELDNILNSLICK